MHLHINMSYYVSNCFLQHELQYDNLKECGLAIRQKKKNLQKIIWIDHLTLKMGFQFTYLTYFF